jgi:hypothetical protein
MYPSGLTTSEWSLLQYKVRVRPTPAPFQCLWGSATLIQNIDFPADKPLILHICNDPYGAPVTFGTQVVSANPPTLPPTQTIVGTLQPGERVSIQVQGFSGVFATAGGDESTVYCLIKEPA